jgi:hypothetical protein
VTGALPVTSRPFEPVTSRLFCSSDSSIFSSFNSKLDNRYQVLTIIGDNSEELDKNNNPVLNPANVNREANYLAEGETIDSLATSEKIQLSVDEWRIIKTAIEH